MTRNLRIGVVKPDWRAAGGFERLLERLTSHLSDVGHTVREVPVPALIGARPVWGVPAAELQWKAHPEFFRYCSLLEDVRRLDLRRFDLVLSTQPPTYFAPHPKVLSLFYHQPRVFYDLAEPYGLLDEVDREHHAHATASVRSIDAGLVSNVKHWLAGSPECRQRLDDFWGVTDNVSLIHAPALTAAPPDPPPWNAAGDVLCVSRHEWPKRTELLSAAAHLIPDRQTVFVGSGGRLPFVKQLDAQLADRKIDPGGIQARDAWMQSALGVNPNTVFEAPGSPNRFLGAVSDAERDARYASASVVVAPAHREDYGLTALEAMLWQRPLIVCEDGGGLVDLVRETGAGLIVEPTPQAVADGVKRIVGDHAFANELIERSKAVPSTFTWERCHQQLDDAVAATLDA